MINNKKRSGKIIKKILVTGGDGAIGSYVTQVFDESEVILAKKETLDITKKSQVSQQVKKHNPDVIIHLAALTNVDYCEQNKSIATKVNYEGSKNVAMICSKYNIPMIYISTATVFDGKSPPKGGYTEDDIPSPINIYAKTKLMGEEVIKKTIKKYIIIRIGWLIGGKKNDNFFISYMSKKILGGEDINAVSDIFGTVAHAQDMLLFIKKKLYANKWGIFHFSSLGVCSRYDIAVVLTSLLNPKVNIIPVNAQFFSKDFPAPRPKYQVIRSKEHTFKQDWKSVLKMYVKTAYLQ